MFSVHTTLGEVWKRNNRRSFLDFYLRKLEERNEMIIVTSIFKIISVHPKRKAAVFEFLQFEERFQKLRIRVGLVWTVALTVETKLRF